MGTILTGIKPTGKPHLGNYVGMIKPTLALINAANPMDKNLVFIANYHALNQERNADLMRENTYHIAATFLALGLDPHQAIFYRQSDVPEIFELATILANLAAKGLLNRAHAYKDAVNRNRQAYEEKGMPESEMDLDAGINMGLFSYPILMAADILLFQSTQVPVGKDQTQHLEIARDVAGAFNRTYGQVLTLPQAYIVKEAAEVPGLDGRKMSKSYQNTIPVFGEQREVAKLIMKIKTDSKLPEDKKDPETSTVFQLYKAFANPDEIDAMRVAFQEGKMGHGESKKRLVEVVDSVLDIPRQRYHEYMSNPQAMEAILQAGGEKARQIAQQTMQEVRARIGVA
jgi:tryptophanyl-tRNA synthetase